VAKERESSPRSHTLLFGDFSKGEGDMATEIELAGWEIRELVD